MTGSATMPRSVEMCHQEILRLRAENERLRLALRREQLTTRCVLNAVADFGAEVATDPSTRFGPVGIARAIPLVETVAAERDTRRADLYGLALPSVRPAVGGDHW